MALKPSKDIFLLRQSDTQNLTAEKKCRALQSPASTGRDTDSHGIKAQTLSQLAHQGLPVAPGLALSSNFCQSVTIGAEKAHHKTALDDALLALTRSHLTHASLPQAEVTKTPKDNSATQPKTAPLFLIARMSSAITLNLKLPFVQGLGFNPMTLKALAQDEGIAFAHHHYQRFIIQYSALVWDIGDWEFEDLVYDYQDQQNLSAETDYTDLDWENISALFIDFIATNYDADIPQDMGLQSLHVVSALSRKWHSSGLTLYRQLHNLPDHPEPSILLQVMHFLNPAKDLTRSAQKTMSDLEPVNKGSEYIGSQTQPRPDPASEAEYRGICYSRNPQTGETGLFGSFDAQDTASPETQSIEHCRLQPSQKLESDNQALIDQLTQVSHQLEQSLKNAVQFSFIYKGDQLLLLNATPLKTEIHVAIKIACDLFDSSLITKAEAVNRIDPTELSHLLHHSLKLQGEKPLLTALPASLGASHGKIALDRHTALTYAHMGDDVILVLPETDPEDVYAIHSVAGLLTSRGGNSSHAAVIARSMGCPCIVDARELIFTKNDTALHNQSFSVNGEIFHNGDYITIDGKNGTVYKGKVALQEPVFPDDLNRLLGWADDMSTMTVRANADNVADTKCALNFGAKGIGLCRTEHMLLTPEALFHFRRVLLENDPAKKSAALQDILLDQKGKIRDILQEMAGLPVTIRLLDPPLHEFLPKDSVEIEALAMVLERPAAELQEIVKALEEKNPMLGHRGCRLAITLPEILEIQTKAILEAAKDVYHSEAGKKMGKKSGKKTDTMPLLEIMIPFVMLEGEIDLLVKRIKTIADEFCKDQNIELNFHIGTMIEIPRAALRANTIARHTDFFSFGTNDLTQTIWGLSRDDADSFLRDYYSAGLLDYDPFKTLDISAVGSVIAQACIAGKQGNPDLTLGICGEHGADPASITFFQSLGLDYISCSAFQVPIARLAAGQAATKQTLTQQKK